MRFVIMCFGDPLLRHRHGFILVLAVPSGGTTGVLFAGGASVFAGGASVFTCGASVFTGGTAVCGGRFFGRFGIILFRCGCFLVRRRFFRFVFEIRCVPARALQ